MTNIVFFFVSLFIVFVLFVLKLVSVSKNRDIFPLNIFRITDPKAEKLIDYLKYKIYQIVQTLRFLVIVKMPEVLKHEKNKMQEKIAEKIDKQRDVILGKINIKDNGSSSFYLKEISEQAKNEEKGRIDESL